MFIRVTDRPKIDSNLKRISNNEIKPIISRNFREKKETTSLDGNRFRNELNSTWLVSCICFEFPYPTLGFRNVYLRVELKCFDIILIQ